MNSLRRLVWLAFVVVSVLLAALLFLGASQYRLDGAYNLVIKSNERALFHYRTIREEITAALINGSWNRLQGVDDDIERLNGELSRLKESRLISAELKLALVDNIDLAGLAILVRQVSQESDQAHLRKQLQQQLRTISDSLIQYDRIIVGQARERIVSFQTVVIGALGLIISLASISLILLYRNTVSPLIQLARIARNDDFGGGPIAIPPPVVDEVAEVIDAMTSLLDNNPGNSTIPVSDRASIEGLGEAINESINRVNGIINYAQLLSDALGESEDAREQRELLQKIIDGGLEIAKTWQKLQ